MGLAISTRVAPELTLPALAAACRSRGLDGLELDLVANDLETIEPRIQGTDARLVSLRISTIEPVDALALCKLSARYGIPVSISAKALSPEALSGIANTFRGETAKLLLEAGTNLDEMLALLATIRLAKASPMVGIAWEIRPSKEDLEDASAVLFACREHLGLVRLYGGGPEQREQDGRGLGMLLTDLALSRYTGPIVLSPSREETLLRWAQWLASKKSAGCGTMAEASRIEVDVRNVEPRDRLDTILSAYDSLRRGATMRLTVDHDPSCMYYTLKAREAEGSFSFHKTEDGPEVWRAEVLKL